MVRKGEILTLNDNNKYVVVSSKILNNINYVYIIDQNNYSNYMFCKYENNILEEVIDKDIIEELMLLFSKEYFYKE